MRKYNINALLVIGGFEVCLKSLLMLVVRLIFNLLYKLSSLVLNINDFSNIITAHVIETDTCFSYDVLKIV